MAYQIGELFSYSTVQIKVGVDIRWLRTEVLVAFFDKFAKFPVVLAGAIALDDDELTCANIEVRTILSEEVPEGVKVMEGILLLIICEEVIATVVAMVEGVPETDKEFGAVEEDCDDAGADGPDIDPENVEDCEAVLSPDLGVLTEDFEVADFKRLEV